MLIAGGSPDVELAVDMACGMPCVGDIPPSGLWESKIGRAELDIESLDHARWHTGLFRAIEAEAVAGATAKEIAAVAEATRDEVRKGLMHGPFTKAQLDAAYGPGKWRAMRRFAVEQKGKIRPCDNAKTSLHNKCCTTFEKVACETADFPARAAGAFADALGGPVPMASSTEDLAEAYRHVPTDAPQWTVVALWMPGAGARGKGEVQLFTMPGFNFGLKTAVPQFNRTTDAYVAFSRHFLGICGCKFFDDFCVAEPEWCARHGQECMRGLHVLMGVPFAKAKQVDASEVVVFLGVESDFRGVERTGRVRMRVRPDRVGALHARIDAVLEARQLPSALASSLCGKLQFTTSWTFARVGRAALQPLFRAAVESSATPTGSKRKRSDGGDIDESLSPGAEMSLQFFSSLLEALPPHEFDVVRRRSPPVLVWSDARWEVGDPRPAGVGFVVAVPKVGAPAGVTARSVAELVRRYDFYHGSEVVPESFMRGFVRRKQQIGQLELLAGLVPYLSMPDVMAGARVCHWIDNTSAVAALTKGYSGVPDSARIVHAFHATLAGLDCRSWLEYVASKANVSDAPSRIDLSGVVWDCGVHADIRSKPVAVVLPRERRWYDEAGTWCRRARRSALSR